MKQRLLDLIYPRVCAACGCIVSRGRHYICWDCFTDFSVISNPYCNICGDPAEGMIENEYTCSWCVNHAPCFDLARSAVRFRGYVKDLLHDYKYSGDIHLTVDLTELICSSVSMHYNRELFDAVVAVPLHAHKERNRTYNQSALLARKVGKSMGIRYVADCLQRLRFGSSQTGCNARQRKLNVKGAFSPSWPDWIKGRTLLLVDDVMTTGATVNEVSRELKLAGAARVCVVTVARG